MTREVAASLFLLQRKHTTHRADLLPHHHHPPRLPFHTHTLLSFCFLSSMGEGGCLWVCGFSGLRGGGAAGGGGFGPVKWKSRRVDGRPQVHHVERGKEGAAVCRGSVWTVLHVPRAGRPVCLRVFVYCRWGALVSCRLGGRLGAALEAEALDAEAQEGPR